MPNPAPMYNTTTYTPNNYTFNVEEWISHSWHPFKSFDKLSLAESCMDNYQSQFGGKFRIVSVIEELGD